MAKLIGAYMALVLVALGSMAHASPIGVDAITYSVDLTTSSGNSISTRGAFSPGADVYCFDFSIFGPCPPGPLFDTNPLDNTNGDSSLFLLLNAQEEAISLLIGDAIVGVPEFIAGTLTFSDIGWGTMGGKIIGGEVCGLGIIGCGPDFGFDAQFFDDGVVVGFDSFLHIFGSSSGALTGIGEITVHFDVQRIPAPATIPLIAVALAAFGLSRRPCLMRN